MTGYKQAMAVANLISPRTARRSETLQHRPNIQAFPVEACFDMPDSDSANKALESAWPTRPSRLDGLCAAPYAAAQMGSRRAGPDE